MPELSGPTHRVVFRMPSLGSDMESGKVVEWQVEPGGFVRRGGILLVVEAEKGELDVEVFEDCVLEEKLVEPGAELAVGTPLAFLRVAGEAPDEVPEEVPGKLPEEVPKGMTAEASPPAVPRPTAPAGTRVSPRGRRRAEELGVDLAHVVGTGPGGAITAEDVEEAAQGPTEPSAMRRAISAAMSRANREIPHYYLSSDVDVEEPLRWLEARNASAALEDRILPAALFLTAAARAAVSVPELNGFWRNERFEPGEGVQLGVAISLKGGGLVNPALQGAHDKTLSEVMAALTDLVARARGGGLKASELAAPTLTVTNLGDLGVDSVFPVIHPPQVAMLGIGRVALRPWVVDGDVVARRVVTFSLAGDHRATDGRVGARFLVELANALANPAALANARQGTGGSDEPR